MILTIDELFIWMLTLLVLSGVIYFLVDIIFEEKPKLKHKNTSISKVNKEINKRIEKMNNRKR